MPFMHVKSLPFDPARNISSIIEGLTDDFAKGTGINLEHITATWEFFLPGHYAVAGRAALSQPETSHPVLVDVLSPDFNSPEMIEKMMRVTASSISTRARIPLRNIFIHHRHARSGMVFDGGDVVRW